MPRPTDRHAHTNRATESTLALKVLISVMLCALLALHGRGFLRLPDHVLLMLATGLVIALVKESCTTPERLFKLFTRSKR